MVKDRGKKDDKVRKRTKKRYRMSQVKKKRGRLERSVQKDGCGNHLIWSENDEVVKI